MRFDSAEKRAGTPVRVPVSPLVRNPPRLLPGSRESFLYRLRVTSSDGVVPARKDPRSNDRRNLGLFLSFDGHGP